MGSTNGQGVSTRQTIVPDQKNLDLNEGHYAELIDRPWVCTDYLYQSTGSHPLVRQEKQVQDIYIKAERFASELYQEIANIGKVPGLRHHRVLPDHF